MSGLFSYQEKKNFFSPLALLVLNFVNLVPKVLLIIITIK